MNSSENILNWFEVSVSDIARAKKFYETIFSIQMEEMDMMGMKMVSFPYDYMNGKLSGALVQSDMHKPSADGIVRNRTIFSPVAIVRRIAGRFLLANCPANKGKITVAIAATNTCCGKPTSFTA